MAKKRAKTKMAVGNRLALLRKERGLTQVQFIDEFSEFCGLTNPITVSSVSSWESNNRIPTVETLAYLSQFYSVSIDYLLNLSDFRSNEAKTVSRQGEFVNSITAAETPLSMAELAAYDNMPVFVEFINNREESRWGILDATNKCVVTKKGTVKISAETKIYPNAIIAPVRTQISQLRHLLDTEFVWVKMKTNDENIAAMYNGRYKHNEDKTCLVNISNGLCLLYTGLDVSYWAFMG